MSIGSSAFSWCKNLKKVLLPNSLQKIELQTFAFCDNLTDITFPTNLTSIEAYAFRSCSSLKTIFLPSSLQTIGTWAFIDCSNLTEINFPTNSKLTTIGISAFGKCPNLTDISLPRNLTLIKDSAFKECEKLAKVTCYASTPPQLGNGAFIWRKIETLYVPRGSVQKYKDNFQWSNYFKNILPIN